MQVRENWQDRTLKGANKGVLAAIAIWVVVWAVLIPGSRALGISLPEPRRTLHRAHISFVETLAGITPELRQAYVDGQLPKATPKRTPRVPGNTTPATLSQ